MNNKNDFFKGLIAGVVSMSIIFGAVFGCSIIFKNMKEQPSSGKIESMSAKDVINTKEFKEKYNYICSEIDKYYLDAEDVDAEKVSDGLYTGLLNALGDKYAAYYSGEKYKELLESSQGQYAGIGAYVSQNQNTGVIVIVNPFENSPADKAGLKNEDILIQVAGQMVTGKDLSEVTELMKGEPGTDVDVQVLRDGEKIDVTITREIVDVPTVKHEIIPEYNIGYIYVSTFDSITNKQFREAVDDIEAKGADGLIVDVRNNGGGQLAAVLDMLDRILPEGLIMYTENKNGRANEYNSTAEESYDKPYAVLINGYSASASEVFAGAVQDYGFGTLVGTKSYGKGVVQTIIPLKQLNDGSAVKVTTSKYFTPKGRNIDQVGIEPDVIVEYDKDKEVKSGDFYLDNQLQEALKIVSDKIKDEDNK